MNPLLKEITSQWHIMRIIRLMIGIMIIAQAFAGRNVMVGILGVIFTAMALFNVGCCGSNGCIPNKKSRNNPNEFTYEEVV